MRLIDADALERDRWFMSRTVQIDEKTMEMQNRKPTDFPAVEPQHERKKGKWLHKKITDDYHVTGQCSNCYERRRIDNFCPNCGARMVRGEEDE